MRVKDERPNGGCVCVWGGGLLKSKHVTLFEKLASTAHCVFKHAKFVKTKICWVKLLRLWARAWCHFTP